MNEAIERMNKKVIISLNEYLELENIKKCHEENMKVSYGKVIIPPEDLERYKALEHNWNELKSWLEENLNELKQNDIYDRTSYEMGQIIATECFIAKMEELEEGGNNDN